MSRELGIKSRPVAPKIQQNAELENEEPACRRKMDRLENIRIAMGELVVRLCEYIYSVSQENPK